MTRYRFIFIGLCTLLMAAGVYVAGESLRQDRRPAVLRPEPTGDRASIPVETGVIRRSPQALDYRQAPENPQSTRTLRAYYANRAFPGAPPVIPHEVLDPAGFGGRGCLHCHENGGYVPRFNAFAPVVPHPELMSCKQCHVPAQTPALFAKSTWQATPPPPIGQVAMPEAPPRIPHTLHMRENCLACHAGPAAVPEIRVTHPERVNCRQCHALTQDAPSWQRQLEARLDNEADVGR